jgi:hypothetical protein
MLNAKNYLFLIVRVNRNLYQPTQELLSSDFTTTAICVTFTCSFVSSYNKNTPPLNRII